MTQGAGDVFRSGGRGNGFRHARPLSRDARAGGRAQSVPRSPGVKVLQALGTEALDREGAHHAAIEHGAAKDGRRERGLRCDVAEESASEGVAGPGGIDDFSQRQRGRAEGDGDGVSAGRKGAIAEEGSRAVFAVLDDESLRPHVENLVRRGQKVVIFREHLHFTVIDQQNVEALQHAGEVLGVILDPVIHRVAADHLHLRHLAADVFLEDGVDVSKEEKLAVLIFGRNFGREALEDVELGVERLRLVEILHVRAAPEEALAGNVLDAARVDVVAGEDAFFLWAEILADHADDADGSEVTGGEGEMRGGAAYAAFPAAGRSFN